MPDDAVVQALAAASCASEPYLANVLATEAMNRMRRARAVFLHVGEGVLTVDADGRVTSLNPAASRALGWRSDEVVGLDLHATVHRADEAGRERPRECCPVLAPLADGAVVEREDALVCRDGEMFPVTLVSAPILREGTIDGAVVAFRDDTGRRRAAAERERLLALAQSRAAELAAVLESIPDSVLIGDEHGIRRANRATCDLLGCEDVEELNAMGARLVDALDARDAATGRRIRTRDVAFVRALAGETVEQSIVLRRLGTREPVFLRCRAAPVRAHGAVVGAVSVNVDVTAQVEAERRVRSWLALVDAFYRAHDRLGEGLVLLEGGRVAFANGAFRRMVGRSEDELRGLPSAFLLVAAERRAEAEDRFRRHAAGDVAESTFEWPLVRADGRRVLAEVSVVPVSSEGPGRLVLVARDVGARAQAWRALLDAYEVLDATFRRAPVGVVCVDRAGRIDRANDAFAAEAGLPPESMPGRLVTEAFPGLEPLVRRVFEEGRPLHGVRAVVGTPPRRAVLHAAPMDEAHAELVVLEVDGRACGARP